MVVWMRWRGHSWEANRAMAVAMIAPAAAALGLLASGAVDDLSALMAIGGAFPGAPPRRPRLGSRGRARPRRHRRHDALDQLALVRTVLFTRPRRRRDPDRDCGCPGGDRMAGAGMAGADRSADLDRGAPGARICESRNALPYSWEYPCATDRTARTLADGAARPGEPSRSERPLYTGSRREWE